MKKQTPRLHKEYLYQLERLLHDPQIGKILKDDLHGYLSLDFKFDNVSLRLCYKLIDHNDEMEIKIVYFGTRGNFYRDLKKYV